MIMVHFGRRDADVLRAIYECENWLTAKVLARLDGYPTPDGCWTWAGPGDRHSHGQVNLPTTAGGGKAMTHRVVWLALVGPIGEGLVLDHDGPDGCHNRACANPAHLEAVTVRHNSVETGTSLAAEHSRRTHCPAGHALNGDNLDPSKAARGRRGCLACKRENSRQRTRLVVAAAHKLGLTKSTYEAIHGRSAEQARQILAS